MIEFNGVRNVFKRALLCLGTQAVGVSNRPANRPCEGLVVANSSLGPPIAASAVTDFSTTVRTSTWSEGGNGAYVRVSSKV